MYRKGVPPGYPIQRPLHLRRKQPAYFGSLKLFFFVYFFETGSFYIAQADREHRPHAGVAGISKLLKQFVMIY